MDDKNITLKDLMYNFAYDLITVEEFETTIFQLSIDSIGDERVYNELICFNYTVKDVGYELYKLINNLWEKTYEESLETEHIRRILVGVIEDSIPIHYACHILSSLYHKGNSVIPYEFDEIYGELLDVPLPIEYSLWNQKGLKVKLEKLIKYKEKVVGLSKKLLNQIN